MNNQTYVFLAFTLFLFDLLLNNQLTDFLNRKRDNCNAFFCIVIAKISNTLTRTYTTLCR